MIMNGMEMFLHETETFFKKTTKFLQEAIAKNSKIYFKVNRKLFEETGTGKQESVPRKEGKLLQETEKLSQLT